MEEVLDLKDCDAGEDTDDKFIVQGSGKAGFGETVFQVLGLAT